MNFTPEVARQLVNTDRRIAGREELKKLEQKFAGTRATPVSAPTGGVADAIFYWYFRQAIDKYQDFKTLRDRVLLLHKAKLIPYAVQQKWNQLIDEAEVSFWELGIQVLNEHRYKDVVGTSRQVNTIFDLATAMHEIDSVVRRIRTHMDSIIESVNQVATRDRLCNDEFVISKQCDAVACQLYKPVLSFGSSPTCRSIMRGAAPP